MRKSKKKKSGPIDLILYWSPRILSILFVAFISLFSLDVFQENFGFWKTLGFFLIHLIPTGILVLVIFVTWNSEWIGGLVFISAGILYMIRVIDKNQPSWILGISGPLWLIGFLFLLNWYYKKGRKKIQD